MLVYATRVEPYNDFGDVCTYIDYMAARRKATLAVYQKIHDAEAHPLSFDNTRGRHGSNIVPIKHRPWACKDPKVGEKSHPTRHKTTHVFGEDPMLQIDL